jgi:hypothetical protein
MSSITAGSSVAHKCIHYQLSVFTSSQQLVFCIYIAHAVSQEPLWLKFDADNLTVCHRFIFIHMLLLFLLTVGQEVQA